jgi:hypothetical protein
MKPYSNGRLALSNSEVMLRYSIDSDYSEIIQKEPEYLGRRVILLRALDVLLLHGVRCYKRGLV